MKKKRTRKNLDGRIKQIMGLALRVNRETPHSVFIEFSGHVDVLMVSICTGGWEQGTSPDYDRTIWMDSEVRVFAKLSEIRAKLNSLLRDAK